jgi:hypothetical protein
VVLVVISIVSDVGMSPVDAALAMDIVEAGAKISEQAEERTLEGNRV